MKSATFPSLRVEPELREAVEAVLQEGETVSSFMEQSIRAMVGRRQLQEGFIARGLGSREAARCSGRYTPADEVLAGLQKRLARRCL